MQGGVINNTKDVWKDYEEILFYIYIKMYV